MTQHHRFRGNTHTHTTVSDGDLPPEGVVRWYREHGYDFLFITDHNAVTDVSGLSTNGFLVLPGCEISLSSEGKPVHVNALNPSRLSLCEPGKTISETLQKEVDCCLEVGALPQINHPNWCWAFTDVEMADVTRWSLLEVFNASTDCNNFGAGGRQSTEETWDRLLAMGKRVYAVAADDSHDYTGQFWGRCSPPGRGWIDLWAESLSADAILRALKEGRFYSSTEIALKRYESDEEHVAFEIEQVADFCYTSLFIGAGGRILEECWGTRPEYRIKGDEGYVRARVFSSNGGYAWTQPVFLDGRK
ncbi:MAG: CehA/McbA family metallohydrolase [Armatimonadota bacterium]